MIFLQALAKYYWFLYYRPTSTEFCKDIYKFWDKRDFNSEIHQYVDYVLKMLNRLETILVALIIIVGVLYGVAPLFFSDKPYILDVGFTIDSGVIKTVVLLSQYYFVALSASVIVAYDVIYISSCCYVLIQIKLLHFIIARLEAATSRRKFINCIQHHIFILK